MSVGLLEKIKEFVVRLVKDTAFRERLDNSTPEERRRMLENAGYSFSKEEWETAAIDLIESKERGELSELTELELVGVFGGVTQNIIAQPMYGVINSPPNPTPNPIHIRPMYGVPVIPD
jgi:predicted ribosomally synthesized peptide with nif11-like leader